MRFRSQVFVARLTTFIYTFMEVFFPESVSTKEILTKSTFWHLFLQEARRLFGSCVYDCVRTSRGLLLFWWCCSHLLSWRRLALLHLLPAKKQGASSSDIWNSTA